LLAAVALVEKTGETTFLTISFPAAPAP